MVDRESLIAAAKEASQSAYAPYSRYKVGAAVLTGDGRIFAGCNVENASYGLTMCAERTAIFHARVHGAESIVAVAIYAPQMPAPTPCGACRQVISEHGASAEIVIVDAENSIQEFSIDELLPHSFKLI